MSIFKNRTVIGVICILLALVICFGITPLFNQSISQKAEIVRVTKDIHAGELITKDMVTTAEVGSYIYAKRDAYANGDVTINTDGEITVNAFQAGSGGYAYSIGVKSMGNLRLTKVGGMTVKWNDEAGGYGAPFSPAEEFDSSKYDKILDKTNCIVTYTPKVVPPTASVGNVIIDGTTGTEITAAEVKITLKNDTFKSSLSGNWITNLPDGLSQSVSCTDNTHAKITVSGTPSVASSADLAITIPAANLVTSTSDLDVTSNTNARYKIKASVAALGGSASISGTAKYGEVLTAETASITGNTGTLTYKWYRSGETTEIATNTTGKYTLVEDDIGKTITVEITSSVESGTIVSSPTATVEKADGPAAPSVTPVACTNSSNNDGKITGVNTTMEYSAASDFSTKTACTSTVITGLANGTYYVRVAETTTHKAGAAATVIVPAYTSGALGGSASISGTAKYDELLTAVTTSITGNTGTFSYQWKRNGADITSATNSTYKLVEDDIGKTITVAITSSAESGTIVSSATATVEKADGPAAPSVTPVACTNSSNNDGKITGVNTTMEYSAASDFSTKTACTGSEITGLANGTYYVRVAETTTHKAGAAATVIVPAYMPGAPTEYTITFDVNGGSGTIPPQTTSGQKLSSLPTATHSGSYSFDGWYTAASGGTQITTAYTFSADTTVYAHWTYTGGGGGGSYYAPVVPDMPMLYRGCTGDAVKTLQDKLNALGYNSGNVDGIFGAKTYAAVTAFQKANGLGVDGIVGKLTWGKLYGVSPAMPVETTTVVGRPMVSYGSRGDAVRKLQELLNALGYDCGSVDGIFGSKTKAAVLAFQKANGLGADGIVGPLTWGKLV